MRNLILQMMTTLNGRLDDPDAWVTGIGDDLYSDIDRFYDTYDTILVGRVTYDEMFAYWPGAEADSEPEITRRMARKMNTYRKLVLSREGEPEPLAWTNAERVPARDDAGLARIVADLKAQPGADLLLAGGASLAQAFIRLGLVDEYRFFVYPAVSPGATWLDAIDGPRGMELIGATAYNDGVVGLRYRPSGGQGAATA